MGSMVLLILPAVASLTLFRSKMVDKLTLQILTFISAIKEIENITMALHFPEYSNTALYIWTGGTPQSVWGGGVQTCGCG